VPRELPEEAAGQRLRELRRRAKYLLFDLERGTMILHLGMSGSLRLLPSSTAPALHDHVDIVLDSGLCVRFNDPRRFGSLLWTREESAAASVTQIARARTAVEGIQWRVLGTRGRGTQRRDQTAHHERSDRRGRRQHLRERSAVPRGHQSASLGEAHQASRVRCAREIDQAVLRSAIRAGGTTLRVT
jgi:formamidopyrimidine-DNA glycosylase